MVIPSVRESNGHDRHLRMSRLDNMLSVRSSGFVQGHPPNLKRRRIQRLQEMHTRVFTTLFSPSTWSDSE